MPEAEWPAWAEELKARYLCGSASFFVLHGNADDLVAVVGDRDFSTQGLTEFLAERLFGSYDLVLQFDPGRGLRPNPGGDPKRLVAMTRLLEQFSGDAQPVHDPVTSLRTIDFLLERALVEPASTTTMRMAFIIDHADLVCGTDERSGAALSLLLNWARSPVIKRVNIVFVLVAGTLSAVHPALIQSGHVCALRVPMPDAEVRKRFVASRVPEMAVRAEMLAAMSAGLTLVNLDTLLRLAHHDTPEMPAAAATQASRDIAGVRAEAPSFMRQLVEREARQTAPTGGARAGDAEQEFLSRVKKQLIEAQCPGLIEFVEPSLDLSHVAGHAAAKDRLSSDARLIREGRLDAVPMGYLVCGPVGVGKTFLVMCYAGSVGIPCVTIRNFRSKYVGETEANLERILNVLRELGPVAVIIDEADAAVGNRGAQGDSGTSARVFASLASQMGNTAFRGRVIWFLLTCRPDLLPIDLKRQGRCEEHIPLFYPETPAETREMFLAMGKKLRVPVTPDMLPDLGRGILSGADIEGVLTRVRREAALSEKPVDAAMLARVLDGFRTPRGVEHELQCLAAVLECSDTRYLPPSLKQLVDKPDGLSAVSHRFHEIQTLLAR